MANTTNPTYNSNTIKINVKDELLQSTIMELVRKESIHEGKGSLPALNLIIQNTKSKIAILAYLTQ